MRIGVMKDSKTTSEEYTRLPCTWLCHSCCHTYLETSVGEVVIVCWVEFREPIHLCTYVSEEGDDGESPWPETPSLMSYTLRYISFTEVDSVGRVVFREPIHLCTYTLRYVSFVEGVIVSRVPFREPIHLCKYVNEEGVDGEVPYPETPVHMCERGGGRRGSSVPRNAISAVIHT